MWWFWAASQERKHSSFVDVDLASNSGSRQTKGCQPSSPRSDTVCVEAYPDTAATWNRKIQRTCSLADLLNSVGSAKGQMGRSREIGRRRMNNLHSETDGKMQNNPKTLLYFVHCPCAVRACIQSHIQCGGITNTRDFITGPQRTHWVNGEKTGSWRSWSQQAQSFVHI